MSSTRHHIPFPRTFLSLNTPTKGSANTVDTLATASPESELSTHSFLSNRPVTVPRHASVSSVSSVDSVASTSYAPTSEPSASPILKAALPTFLALNTKHEGPPASATEMKQVEKHGFLSNKN